MELSVEEMIEAVKRHYGNGYWNPISRSILAHKVGDMISSVSEEELPEPEAWADAYSKLPAPQQGQTEPQSLDKVCTKCGVWVYYDNGDCTFHCGCNSSWVYEHEFKAAAKPQTEPQEDNMVEWGSHKVKFPFRSVVQEGESEPQDDAPWNECCKHGTPLDNPCLACVKPQDEPKRPVNRWDRKEDSAGEFMGLVSNGEFVRYCDYQALEGRVRELEADKKMAKRIIMDQEAAIIKAEKAANHE